MSCPVCFNAALSDDSVRQSVNLGIFVLMGITGVVLAGFLRFIVSLVRLSAADLQVRLSVDGSEGDGGADQSTEVGAGLQARLPV